MKEKRKPGWDITKKQAEDEAEWTGINQRHNLQGSKSKENEIKGRTLKRKVE